MTLRKSLMAVVSFALVFVTAFYFIGGQFQTTRQKIRTMTLRESSIDYQSIFEGFDDPQLLIDEETNSLKFSGTKPIPASIFDEFDLVNMSSVKEECNIRYTFDYCADTNEYHLSAIADSDNGEIIDDWYGVPFTTETGEIDIVFETDEGIVFLSDLEESGALNNCGWFSKLLKVVAVVAVAVAVVAVVAMVVIVAAPAVAAAATTIATAVSAGGGVAALTGGAAAAAVAAAAAAATAAATTAFAIATTTALVATAAAVTAYLGSHVFANLQAKVAAAQKELAKTKEFAGTIIFRGQSYTSKEKSLTPRPSDKDGASFFNNYTVMFGALTIKKGVFITTSELVNATGSLKTVTRDAHVSVLPTAGDLAAWQATHATAETNPHYYTKLLGGICFYVGA
jgi:hypothetical protein